MALVTISNKRKTVSDTEEDLDNEFKKARFEVEVELEEHQFSEMM